MKSNYLNLAIIAMLIFGSATSNSQIAGKINVNSLSKSAFPEISCPLVDNLPQVDILDAANSLSKNIDNLKMSNQCKDDTSLTSIQSYLKAIKDSSALLKGSLGSDDPNVIENLNPADVQKQVENVITSIQGISTSISSNSLLNKNCAHEMMSTSQFLTSISDLVNAVTPIAMTALELNPGYGTAIKYLIGISGAGNVTKILDRMSKENSINIQDDNTRKALLQNICEYTRIKRRADLFNLAALGDLSKSTEELESLKKPLFLNLSTEASEVFNQLNSVKTKAILVKNQAIDDLAEVKKMSRNIELTNDDTLKCYSYQSLAQSISDEIQAKNDQNLFMVKTIQSLKNAVNNKNSEVILSNSKITLLALLRAEEDIRNQLRLDKMTENLLACNTKGTSYLAALTKISQETRRLAVQMIKNVDQNLLNSGNAELKFAAIQSNANEYENSKLSLLIKNGQKLNQSYVQTKTQPQTASPIADSEKSKPIDFSSVVIMEMKEKIDSIKLALFAPRAGLLQNLVKLKLASDGNSPALSWYLYVDNQIRVFQQKFKNGVASLKNEAMLYFNLNTAIYKNIDKYGNKVSLPAVEQNKLVIAAIERRESLEDLSLKNIKENTPAHKSFCFRVYNVIEDWQGTMAALGALKGYCSYLQDFIDDDFDSEFVKSCKGIVRSDGKQLVPSKLMSLESDLKSKSQKEAVTILTKFNELKCPTLLEKELKAIIPEKK